MWRQLAAYAKRFRPGFFVWLGPGREDNFNFEWHGQWDAYALIIRATLAKSGHPILNPAAHYANMQFWERQPIFSIQPALQHHYNHG